MNWDNDYKILISAIIILLGHLGQVTFGDEVSPIVVDTENGPVQGVIKSGRSGSDFVAFLGLRYANPATRFEPSTLLEQTWTEPRVADSPGSACAQPGLPESDEDCLFLNVYVPQKHLENEVGKKKLPVVIWIHGGGLLTGDGFSNGPEYFMENGDVILINLNYRLGIFGFISTGDNTLSPNNGLRDVITALKWVQSNIAVFEGDPDQITISGESAGGITVHYLLMTPEAEGLYHKAVIQSGSFAIWGYDLNPGEAAVNVAKHLKCDLENEEPSSVEIRKCLEEKSTTELVAAQIEFMPRWPHPIITATRFLPTAEVPMDKFFYRRPGSIVGKRSKYAKPIPVIIGTTKDEGALFASLILSEESNVQLMNEDWDQFAAKALCLDTHFSPEDLPLVTKKVREFYFGSKLVSFETRQEMTDVLSDVLFVLPVFLAAKEMAQQGFTVYPYTFAYEGDSNILRAFGLLEFPGMVSHADELRYMFPHDTFGRELTPDDENFSKRFVALWKSFAKHGIPSSKWGSSESAFDWKPLQLDDQQSNDVHKVNYDVLWIDKDPHIVKIDLTDRVRFWMDLIQDYGLISKKQVSTEEEVKFNLKAEL